MLSIDRQPARARRLPAVNSCHVTAILGFLYRPRPGAVVGDATIDAGRRIASWCGWPARRRVSIAKLKPVCRFDTRSAEVRRRLADILNATP
jgi:hypothetical protein